jgi:hypothetical protein
VIAFCFGEVGAAFDMEVDCWLLERECVGVAFGRSRLALCVDTDSRGGGGVGAVGRTGLAKLRGRTAFGASKALGGPVIGEDMRCTKSSKGELS